MPRTGRLAVIIGDTVTSSVWFSACDRTASDLQEHRAEAARMGMAYQGLGLLRGIASEALHNRHLVCVVW
jgi:hypothetical protein